MFNHILFWACIELKLSHSLELRSHLHRCPAGSWWCWHVHLLRHSSTVWHSSRECHATSKSSMYVTLHIIFQIRGVLRPTKWSHHCTGINAYWYINVSWQGWLVTKVTRLLTVDPSSSEGVAARQCLWWTLSHKQKRRTYSLKQNLQL